MTRHIQITDFFDTSPSVMVTLKGLLSPFLRRRNFFKSEVEAKINEKALISAMN